MKAFMAAYKMFCFHDTAHTGGILYYILMRYQLQKSAFTIKVTSKGMHIYTEAVMFPASPVPINLNMKLWLKIKYH